MYRLSLRFEAYTDTNLSSQKVSEMVDFVSCSPQVTDKALKVNSIR